MNQLPTMPLLVDSFIADTAHMSVEEVGAHIRLLVFAWRSPGCCLPDDDARLARMLGTTLKRWAAIKPAVMALWDNSGGNYTHNRLTRERQFVSAKVERKRAAGRLGGRPNSLQLQEPDGAIGSAIEEQNESKPKASKPTSKESLISPCGDEPDGFAEFKAAYPKRNVAFPTTLARKRWLQARRQGATPAEIIAGAKAYAAEQERIGKVGSELVKTADAWLNQGRWKDYATELPSAGSTPTALPDETWRDRVRSWRARGGHWPWRPIHPPDDPRTQVPGHILAEFGIGPDGGRSEPVLMTGTG